MKQYLDLLEECLHGNEKSDRTGTGTHSVFGYQMRFDLQKGFPLLTTKRVHIKSVIHELLWMISGSTNVKYLQENGVRIWDEWADAENGELGPVYGKQWRNFGPGLGYGTNPDIENVLPGSQSFGVVEVDQLDHVIEQIKCDPYSRRHIVTAWNPIDVDRAALPPCHILFQFYVNDGKLSCQLYQRSADVFLGVPFNMASYALLTMMVAQVTGLKAHEFIHTFGDVHLYKNHVPQALEQLSRDPKPLPEMFMDPRIKDIDKFVYEDFVLTDYDPHPSIRAKVSV